MSTLTIELPETLSKQIQRKRISQQQLETIFSRVLQLYLNEIPLTTMNTERTPSHPPKTLRDLRGSIPVTGPQDFDAIRQQVISTQIRLY
ncbi:hypothetical protein U27_01001 [Candidatus Vecturithrix granuli]|uniref:Uncharacterized protein n=1 Tax=Vecturithrix granuli TaxID=1499967 RepID=A0A081C948_VECG1|nr:hypothetical protein U27_01001 [Candidatus Vecturithrix granuli]